MARMLDIRERTQLRRLLYAKPTILALLFGVGLIINGVWGIYVKEKEALAKRDKANAELFSLQQREAQLEEDIARFSSDRGLEAEIRDRFMVAKEDEKVIIIATPDEKKVHTVTTVSEEETTFVDKMMSAAGLSN